MSKALILCFFTIALSVMVTAGSAASTAGGVTYNGKGVITGFDNPDTFSNTAVVSKSVGNVTRNKKGMVTDVGDVNSTYSNTAKITSATNGITRNKKGVITNVTAPYSNTAVYK